MAPDKATLPTLDKGHSVTLTKVCVCVCVRAFGVCVLPCGWASVL